MSCGSCGTENPAGASFCMACGARLERRCASCGAAAPPEARFCMSCGSQLDQIAATSPPLPRAAEQPPEERRQVTVLFADLSGYTAVAERMDPEAVKALVDRALMRLGQEVERYGGTVDKYIGDNVMAIFTETGDTVNVAARLQSAARPGSVTVGERTMRATVAAVRYDELAPLTLKGKSEPVPAWEALAVTAGQAVGRPAAARESPLVGRDNELATLETIYARVERDCIPHLVTLVGEAGVGQSRRLREVGRRPPSRARAPPFHT